MMKKGISFSRLTIVMLALLVIIVAYVFLYFVPAQSELTMLRSELTLYNTENTVYRQYLTDSTPLENEIAAIEAEIATLRAEGYVNDSSVNFVISDAIQRYQISLSSVSLDSASTFEGDRVLPINLTVSGSFENLMDFIAYFENNEDGSYMVRGVSYEVSGQNVNASVVVYLCTPNL